MSLLRAIYPEMAKAWDESQHPRDDDGKFAASGASSAISAAGAAVLGGTIATTAVAAQGAARAGRGF